MKYLMAWLLLLSFQTLGAEENPDWLIFTAELQDFVQNAGEIHEQRAELPSDILEKRIEELFAQGERIAHIYFENLNEEVRPDLENHLNRILIQNQDLEAYFSLLGNAFFDQAEQLNKNQSEKNKNIQRYSTIGGTVLGLAGGGLLVFTRAKLSSSILKASAVVIGLGVAGGAVGYGGSYLVTRYMLPASPGVLNAKDFLERYPDGQDFIEDLRELNDEDLLLGLDELEDNFL